MEACKKMWVEPKMEAVTFAANEYVAVCGKVNTSDGGFFWLVPTAPGAYTSHDAWNRTPANNPDLITDDTLSNKHTIWEGSFYFYDKEKVEIFPDATANGHIEKDEDGTYRECVQDNGTMWGYHYDIGETSNFGS